MISTSDPCPSAVLNVSCVPGNGTLSSYCNPWRLHLARSSSIAAGISITIDGVANDTTQWYLRRRERSESLMKSNFDCTEPPAGSGENCSSKIGE